MAGRGNARRRKKAAARAKQQAAPREPGSQGPGIVRRQEKKKRGKGRGQPQAAARNGGPGTTPRHLEALGEAGDDGFKRHCEVPLAHGDAVQAIIMAEDAVYTASRDKVLKRWRARKNEHNRFELHVDLEVPLGEACWCLLSAGDWLLCGLGDGSLRAYHKAGRDVSLPGHTKRVACLLMHQHVLLSGSMDGTVRCWQYGAESQTFACTHVISEGISGSVLCMSVLNDHLWVGGASGVAIVELNTLRVKCQIPPKKFVAGLLQFEGHMIVAFQDGSLYIFDAGGNQKHHQPPLAPGPLLCIAGLEAGPRVLVGHAKGQVSSITLPMFTPKVSWQALERCKVQSFCVAGHDGIFVIGAENGCIQLWQRDESADL